MNFQANYAGLNDDELLAIAASRADLVQEAAFAMDSEMARRGLSWKPHEEEASSKAGIQRSNEAPFSKEALKVLCGEGEWLDVAAACSWCASAGIRFDVLSSRPKEWYFPILGVCMGAVIAVSAVQPMKQSATSKNLPFASANVSCSCSSDTGSISTPIRPQSRGRVKGSRGSYHRSRLCGGNSVISAAPET